MVQKDEWYQRCKKEKSQTPEDEKTSHNVVHSSFSLSISVPFAASFDFSNSPPLIATVTVTPTNINITIIVIISAISVIPFFVFHLYFSFFLFLSGRPEVRPLHALFYMLFILMSMFFYVL